MKWEGPKSGGEAERMYEQSSRLIESTRIAVTIILVVYLGLFFCLRHVERPAAEYYISIVTLVLNTVLFAAVLIVTARLKRRQRICLKRMEQYRAEEKPDPWLVSHKKEGESHD